MNLVTDDNISKTKGKCHSEKDPLRFLHEARLTPSKRPAKDRRIDFKEIYSAGKKEKLAVQAERCLDCGNPYCEWKCPLHNYIPNWLELVQNNQLDAAAELMYQTNPLPEICGRVCPQDRLCEQACTLNTGFGAVTIGAIEKDVSDRAIAKKWRPNRNNIPASSKKVAIVGAGPAGLACADQLARNGIKATVYDQYPEIGGLLTFGIPGFKLEKNVMRKRREFLQDIGVKFELNTTIGQDISFDEINTQNDSVFLAMGTYQSVQAPLQGLDSKGVIKALDYLIGNINHLEKYQMTDYPYHDLKGKKVIVLGGGDTAMDCVRTAIRQGANSVTCVYRRDEKSMPGSKKEVANAKEEGVNFKFNFSPISIESNDSKRVIGLKVCQTKASENQRSERTQFEPIEDSEQVLETDIIITAFGFRASPTDWFSNSGIKTKENGLIETLPSQNSDRCYSQQTSLSGIFAGGDMVRGADLVVTAIAEGIQAANEIIDYFSES